MAQQPQPSVQPAGHPIATIAALLDLTDRRIRQLSADGIIPKPTSHGRYEIAGCVRGYIKYLRERAIQGDPSGADDVGSSRVALLKAKARMATLEADEYESHLLRRDDVEKAWVSIIANVRTRLLAIPSSAAQSIVYLRTPAEIAALLTAAVTEALDDISNTPVYVEGAQSLNAELGVDGARGVTGSEASADPDGEPVVGSEASAERGVVSGAGAMEH